MNIQPQKSDPQQPSMASAKGDLRQLKQNSSATVTELKAFLKDLKGKSPQEMLGVVAGSQLVRAIGLATVIVLLVSLVFTAVPYAMGDRDKEEIATKESSAPSAAEPAIPKPAPTPSPTAPAVAQPSPTTPDLSTLGVNEERKAPPNKNPLESKKDDFLKGLE
jgi:hypothetical protein